MTTHTIRKHSGQGISHAVVPLNRVNHVFASAVAGGGATLREQTEDALEAIAAVMAREGAQGSVVHQTVFLADARQAAYCRQIVREFYGSKLPAVSYVPQAPCAGKLVAIEALGLGEGWVDITIERVSEQLVVARQDGVTWVYAAQAVPRTSAPGVYEKATCSFQHLRRILPRAGVQFDQILRAWFYVGGIVDAEGPTQRYKEFNRARTDFYEQVPFLDGRVPADHAGRVFPASTGIGTAGRGICMSALALASTRPEVVAVPLENPRQTAAYNYGAAYSLQSPKFSRGMALRCGPDTILFVSGTASITNSETRHPGDVQAQTHETLDNIAALISEDNLAGHGQPGAGTSLDGLGLVRVYVKRPDDYAAVRRVCESRVPNLPATYVVADVCRPDLLVEIEGMAFARLPSAPPAEVPLPGCHWRRLVAAKTAQPAEAASCAALGCGDPASGSLANGRARFPCCPLTCPERSFCPDAFLE